MDYKYLLIIIILSLSFFVDKAVSLFLNGNRIWLLDNLAYYADYFNTIVIFILISLFLIFKERKKLFGFIFGFGFLGIFVFILKLIIGRIRPFVALSLERIINVNYNFSSWSSSFPSWHSIVVFFVLPFLDNKYKVIWFLIAVIVVFFRVYTGVHYLSDILFGALIGYITGYLCKEYLVD